MECARVSFYCPYVCWHEQHHVTLANENGLWQRLLLRLLCFLGNLLYDDSRWRYCGGRRPLVGRLDHQSGHIDQRGQEEEQAEDPHAAVPLLRVADRRGNPEQHTPREADQAKDVD